MSMTTIPKHGKGFISKKLRRYMTKGKKRNRVLDIAVMYDRISLLVTWLSCANIVLNAVLALVFALTHHFTLLRWAVYDIFVSLLAVLVGLLLKFKKGTKRLRNKKDGWGWWDDSTMEYRVIVRPIINEKLPEIPKDWKPGAVGTFNFPGYV